MVSLPTGTFLNAEAIYKGLLAFGLSPNAAAGVAGNIYQESHGNPSAYSPAGGGLFGLTIANGGTPGGGTLAYELSKLLAYIKANGSIANINAHASTPTAAAEYFSNNYERPGIPAMYNRTTAAEWIAQAAKSGNWGKGSPATPTPPASHTSTSTVPAKKPAAPTTGTTTPPAATTPSNSGTTTSFPGGAADPLNWGTDIGNAIGNALNPTTYINDILNALNPMTYFNDLFGSAVVRDYLKRFGLIILGGLLVIVGVWILAGKQVTEIAAKTVV